jgi:glyoxylase-like metal-dependent hydrolase (beta-lactamase superfamily II)
MAAELERLTPLVGRLLAPNPSPMTLTGTNTYLVGQAEVAVIDPGPDLPEHVDAIVAALERLGRPAISLVTHHHGDHLPAAIRLRERLGVPVGGHAELPGVDRALAHDDLIILTDARLRALHTPGHTPDHVCYLLENESALFAGDLIAGTGTVVVGSGRGELSAYLASLDLVAEVEAAVLYPGHGPFVDDPARRIAEYQEHRLGRERQVVDALRIGCTSVADIVERLYADVPRHLHAQAGRNVVAHLMKLEDEGRARMQSDGWHLISTGT